MNDLLGLFCIGSLIALMAALALVGGWTLVQRARGRSTHDDSHPPVRLGRKCPQCNSPLSELARQCAQCGWRQDSQAVAGLAMLDTTARQLELLSHAGLLDAATHERVRMAVDAQRQRLTAAANAVSPWLAPPIDSPTAPATPPNAAPAEMVVAELIAEPAGEPVAALTAASTDVDPLRRVRDVLARQSQDAAARAAQPSEAIEKPPAKPFSQLLAAFLEEKNIRWGELVGGLLIVGGSIALVLSFWAQIAERPLLKFSVFNGVTAGMFGIGFFIVRRWKLPTTGQGLLLISTLLVPLDMLAIAAIAREAGVEALAGEAVSIALFAWLLFSAGRVLVERWPVALVAGVLGPSIAELVIARHVTSGTSLGTLYLLAALPLACYLAATAWPVARIRREAGLDEPEGLALFKLLGLASFAALLPIGLLAYRTGRGAGAL
ncbi:MAG TPA: hypothetical protein VGX78_15705, partial [Pirellulales bacterium]|nr:hypothetical protein [Pirellulales bacterium]